MDERIDLALHSLAGEVAFPPTPDLRASVADGLARPSGARRWWPRSLPRALALALIATLVVVATAAALVLFVPGLRLTLVPAVPSAGLPDGPLAARMGLGQPVAPEGVSGAIPAAYGTPDEAYALGDHEVLTLVYRAEDGLEEMGETGIGLLVQRIEGALDGERVEKLVAEVGATVQAIEVEGAPGYWISGPPHLVRYTTTAGLEHAQATRVAGDSLVWERDGVLYRIESGLGLAETLRIAESVAP
jgi:hypothetical protein